MGITPSPHVLTDKAPRRKRLFYLIPPYLQFIRSFTIFSPLHGGIKLQGDAYNYTPGSCIHTTLLYINLHIINTEVFVQLNLQDYYCVDNINKFHILDQYLILLCSEFRVGNKRRINPEYSKLYNHGLKLKKIRELGQISENRFRSEFSLVQSEMRSIPSVDLIDSNFARLKFVRYEGNVLISFIGLNSSSQLIFNKLEYFVKNDLGFSLSPGRIMISSGKKGCVFLGVKVRIVPTDNAKLVPKTRGDTTFPSRVNRRIRFTVDIISLFNNFVAGGFIKFSANKSGGLVPLAPRGLCNYSHSFILHYYNIKVKKLMDYYSFIPDRRPLFSVLRILNRSCAKTLAKKYKLGSTRRVYKKYGVSLCSKGSTFKFFLPKSYIRRKPKYL